MDGVSRALVSVIDTSPLETSSPPLVGVVVVSLRAKSRKEWRRSSLRYSFFSDSRSRARAPLVVEYTLNSELDNREKEEMDRDVVFIRLRLDMEFLAKVLSARAGIATAGEQGNSAKPEMLTAGSAGARSPSAGPLAGVEEAKLGDTLGEVWDDEDEESIEQERLVSKPESTEFFLSTAEGIE